MALRDLIKPKSKTEIIEFLKNLSLDEKLLKHIIENENAFQYVISFLMYRDLDVKQKIDELNDLSDVFRSIK